MPVKFEPVLVSKILLALAQTLLALPHFTFIEIMHYFFFNEKDMKIMILNEQQA